MRDESRLLGDLHLNSITVGQLAAEAARRLEVPPPVTPTDYATATVAELAEALERLGSAWGELPALNDQGERLLPGVDSWVRAFSVELVERALPRRTEQSPKRGSGRVLASPEDRLAEELRRALSRSDADDGVAVCLPRANDESSVSLLLEGARKALANEGPARFVLVERRGSWGGASFARTLHLEAPRVNTAVVVVPPDHPQSVKFVLDEIHGAAGYTEAHDNDDGRRREPVLRPLALGDERRALPLDSTDVLLVDGGRERHHRRMRHPTWRGRREHAWHCSARSTRSPIPRWLKS